MLIAAATLCYCCSPAVAVQMLRADAVCYCCAALLLLLYDRWMTLEPGSTPTGLYLSSAKSGDNSLLEDSVQVSRLPSYSVSYSAGYRVRLMLGCRRLHAARIRALLPFT